MRKRLAILLILLLFALTGSGCGAEPEPIELLPLREALRIRAAEDAPPVQITVSAARGEAVPAVPPTPEPEPEDAVRDYVLNQSSKRFHLPECQSVADIKPKNRADVTARRSELLAQGYKPCGNCKP